LHIGQFGADADAQAAALELDLADLAAGRHEIHRRLHDLRIDGMTSERSRVRLEAEPCFAPERLEHRASRSRDPTNDGSQRAAECVEAPWIRRDHANAHRRSDPGGHHIHPRTRRSRPGAGPSGQTNCLVELLD
jgi:hypothetical protein